MREYDHLLRALARGENPQHIVTTYRRPGAGLTEILTEVTNAHTRVAGIGPQLAPLLDLPHLTDILVNNTQVWIDRGEGIERTDITLTHEHEARQLAVHMAAACGKRLDDASPIVDGVLPGGVRLHAVLAPLSSDGTLISLRIPRANDLTCERMEEQGSIHPQFMHILRSLMRCRANVLISGATGSGKTTLLGALLAWADPRERLICIEEVSELHPAHPHVVHVQERHRNVQGEGAITLSDLVRAAMRMRPDRLILGECRGAEIRDVLAALNTGHDGGWATIHANTVHDIPARLCALGALAGMSEAAVAAQSAAAFHAVIQMKRRVRGAAEEVRRSAGEVPEWDEGAACGRETLRYPREEAAPRQKVELPPALPTRHYVRGHYPKLEVAVPKFSEEHGVKVCEARPIPTRWVAQIGVVSCREGQLICECACEWEPGGELRTGEGWERLMRLISQEDR